MRELKFRVWDVKLNEYVPKRELDRNFGLDFNGELRCLLASREKDPFILQQYTGYKDFDNVDIYDGDILKNLTPHRYSPDIFVVEWSEFEPSDDMGVGGVGFVLPWFHCSFRSKIVGNIFENEELLK
jgi:hypothetical protein